ncbi:hypothetical protein PVAP13_3KG398102 [Panicum virgatum]|uniref:Reverse transcriptase domain-containing protein n=1 Tax=Panicum virgatum TaxID=38727 RepID=A0A8T0VBG0_PANVG|nr:hypothetical protein PVAP13_3KG398102 [Panicum virgatum]
MDEVTRDIQGDITWCMFFADDVVLVDESMAGDKTEYMMCDFSATMHEGGDVSLDGQVLKWRQPSGILCDRRVPQKLKGKFYRTAIRPAMLYAEMRMLRWFCGHTRRDGVRNEVIRERVGVAPIEEKLTQHRLRWFGHIQRMPPEAPVRSGILNRVDKVKRGRCRPKLSWDESVKRDLKDWNISEKVALDSSAWRLAISVAEP